MHTAPRTARRSEAGFTLVEAVVAVVVLSFGLIAITNLMIVAAASNTAANQATAAAAVASEEMERLKALPFSDPLLAMGGDLESNSDPYWTARNLPGVGQIRVRWMIQDVAAGLKFIVVRAEGLGTLGGGRSRAEFRTFRTENPDPTAP